MASNHTPTRSKFSDNMRGVHVIPRSPFYLQEIDSHGNCISSPKTPLNHLIFVHKLWQQRPGFLNLIHGCAREDTHFAETIANVLTSLPFIALGLQAPRKNPTTTLYANSLIGVGVASSLYHSSRGRIKKYLRWLDYTMIATATVCLSRALGIESPKAVTAATAALLPVQPLMVTAVHTWMMETTFAKRASEEEDLRMAYNVHKMSSVVGGALFLAEDMFPATPFLHAGWHLAAAVGIGTCNKLLG